MLLAEGREETNWNKAREAYNDVQRCIVHGEQLELYDDVERLLPDHIKPQCFEMMMEIEEYDRSTTEKSRKSTAQDPSKKRKRNDDPTRDVPPGACTGFVSVSDLLVKQKGKRRKKITKFDEDAGLDDETDEEIEAGLFVPRRAASTSATSTKPPKTKLKRAKTTVDGGKKRQATRKRTKARVDAGSPEPSPSQFSCKGVDDSKDMDIEMGLWKNSHSPPPRLSPAPMRSSSPDIPLVQDQSIIDICTSAAHSRSPSPKRRYSSPSRPSGEIPASLHVSPSPPNSPSVVSLDDVVPPEPYFGSLAPSKEASDQEAAPKTNGCEEADDSLAWLLADSDDAGEVASSPVAGPRPRMLESQESDAIVIEDSEPENGSPIVLDSSPVPRRSGPPMSNRDMPPPALPPPRLRLDSSSPVAPPPSLPIRAAGQAKRRPVIVPASDSSSPLRPPPPSQKRLHRRRHSHDSSPSASPAIKKRKFRPATKRLKVRDTAEAARVIPWIDVEAGHSGDEVSSGSSMEEAESEGDRRFVTDLPATQPSPSYDQSAVYRQSLLSQAPVGNGFSVPKFVAPPARRGVPLRGPPAAAAAGAALDPGLRPRHERARQSSSPAPPDEEDYYMLGSFVVDDEAEISFSQSSEP